MAAEIAEQPDILARLLREQLPEIRAVGRRLRDHGPRFVLLAGRGTSGHAALYAKYLVETALPLPAGLASLTALTSYQARPNLTGAVWIATSQSGASPDLVEATAAAHAAGALTVALTNTPGSPLADAAELRVDLCAGPERAVAATKTYTAQLLALYLLIDAWAGGDGTLTRALPGLAAETLERSRAAALAPRYRRVEHLVLTGRGYAYPTAREAALKMMETCYVNAQAFSGAELLHGSLAMLTGDRPVIAVAPPGVGGRLLEPVLHRLRVLHCDVLVVGDPDAAPWAAAALPLPGEVPEQLAPILQILPLQQLAHAAALDRGYDPDRPRRLSKITRTR